MEIAVKHLCKSFGGRTVLRDLTFTAGPGITAVMAPSGTGKTTLLRILLGLERPDSGTVEGLAGKRLTAVFQEDRLLEHLSAEGNLRFVLGRVYDPAAARALLDRLGLPDTGAQPVHRFCPRCYTAHLQSAPTPTAMPVPASVCRFSPSPNGFLLQFSL